MSMAIGVIGIILALVALMYLAYRDWSPLYLGFIVTLIVIVTNGMPLTATITDVYLPGVASFAGPYFGMMLFGAIIGKIYDVSGAATSIARGLIGALSPAGSGRSDNFRTAIVVLIACLTGAVLTYPGMPIKLSDTPCSVHYENFQLGAATEDIMTNLLGYTQDEFHALRAAHIV